MAATHGIGRLFVQPIGMAAKSPAYSIAPTFEIEYPYRASRSVVLRLPFTPLGLVVGWWEDNPGQDDDDAIDNHLYRAITSARGSSFFLAGAEDEYRKLKEQDREGV